MCEHAKEGKKCSTNCCNDYILMVLLILFI